MVHRLKDKFDGLELNHIARKFNEAADELAKMASARAPPPRTYSPETCTSPRWTTPRRHKRAHRSSPPQGLRPPMLPRPRRPSPRPWKSMQGLPRPIGGRTSRSPSLIASFEECFLRTGPRPNGLRDEPKLTSSATASCTDEAHLASSNDASPPRKAKPYFGTYTREPTGTMLRLGRSSETPSAKGSTGQQRLPMPPSCTLLRGMSVLCTADAPLGPSPPNHPHHMAVRRMGTRHGWASAESPRGLYPLVGSY